MTQHSIFGGSSAKRWTKCVQSLCAPTSAPSIDHPNTRVGTALHTVLERAITRGKTPTEKEVQNYLAVFAPDVKYNPDTHLFWAEQAYCTIREWTASLFGEDFKLEPKHCEVRVSFKDPRIFGTADILIRNKQTLLVADFKFGFGKVEIARNPQLAYYALAALDTLNVSEENRAMMRVIGGIIQPPVNNVGYEVLPNAFLTAMHEAIHGAVAEYDNRDNHEPRYSPGEHCSSTYCPRRRHCPAVAGLVMQAVEEELLEDGTTLQDQVARAHIAKSWADDILAQAADIVRKGGRIDGYALKPAGSTRDFDPKIKPELVKKVARRVFMELTPADVFAITPAKVKKHCEPLYTEYEGCIIEIPKTSNVLVEATPQESALAALEGL